MKEPRFTNNQQVRDWTVLKYSRHVAGRSLWLCRCKCGIEREIRTDSLADGSSSSCRSCAAKAAKRRPPAS